MNLPLPSIRVPAPPSLFLRPKAIVRHKMSSRDEGVAFFSHCHRQPPQPPPNTALSPSPLSQPPLSPPTYIEISTPNFSSLQDLELVTAATLPQIHVDGGAEGHGLDKEDSAGLFYRFNGLTSYVDPYLVGSVDSVRLDAAIGLAGRVLVVDVELRVAVRHGTAGLVQVDAGFWVGKSQFDQLNSVLVVPRRPPDPRIVVLALFVRVNGLEAWSETIFRNFYDLSAILYPHVTQIQALRDLIFCLPTDGPVLDRSTVALDVWGYLPFFGSGNRINGWTELVPVDLESSV